MTGCQHVLNRAGDRCGEPTFHHMKLCRAHHQRAKLLRDLDERARPPRKRRLVGQRARGVAESVAEDPRPVFTEAEAAALLGLRPRSLQGRRLAARHHGSAPPWERDDGRVVYRREALIAWLEDRAVNGGRPRRRLTLAEAREIRASSEGTGALARRYGVYETTIAHVRAGRIWREC